MTQKKTFSAREAAERRMGRATTFKRAGIALLTVATVGVAAITIGTRAGCGRNNEFSDVPGLREIPRNASSETRRPLFNRDAGPDADYEARDADADYEATEEVIHLKGSVMSVNPDSGVGVVTDQRDENELEETVIAAQPDGGFSVTIKMTPIGVIMRPPSGDSEVESEE